MATLTSRGKTLVRSHGLAVQADPNPDPQDLPHGLAQFVGTLAEKMLVALFLDVLAERQVAGGQRLLVEAIERGQGLHHQGAGSRIVRAQLQELAAGLHDLLFHLEGMLEIRGLFQLQLDLVKAHEALEQVVGERFFLAVLARIGTLRFGRVRLRWIALRALRSRVS